MAKMFVVFDIDGTISDCSHRIEFAKAKQWDEFHKRCIDDPVIVDVADLLIRFRCMEKGLPVCKILLTGRTENYRQQTLDWLKTTGLDLYVDRLLMRPEFDYSVDHEMKIKQLEQFFGSRQRVIDNVWFVVDDRDSVVEALRNYGLTVFQPSAGGY